MINHENASLFFSHINKNVYIFVTEQTKRMYGLASWREC